MVKCPSSSPTKADWLGEISTFSPVDLKNELSTETLSGKNDVYIHELPQWVLFVVPMLTIFTLVLLVLVLFLTFKYLEVKRGCRNCKKMKNSYIPSSFHSSSPLFSETSSTFRTRQSQNHQSSTNSSRNRQTQNHQSSTNLSDPSFSFVDHRHSENVGQILLTPLPSQENVVKENFHSVLEF